jgi:hypothetical protein
MCMRGIELAGGDFTLPILCAGVRVFSAKTAMELCGKRARFAVDSTGIPLIAKNAMNGAQSKRADE